MLRTPPATRRMPAAVMTRGRPRPSAGLWRASGLRLGLPALLVGVPLLTPGVRVHMVPTHLPEPPDVSVGELEASEPLRALPRVPLRHHEAERIPVVRLEWL